MKIACLAWGSLLWKTQPLVLESEWHPDGPQLPIEFARVGDKGELSTALCDGAALQSTWWAVLTARDLDDARELLRQREAIDPARPDWVGSLPLSAAPAPHASGTPGPHAVVIRQWMAGRTLDAVVWTALPPRFDGIDGRRPGPSQAVDYLRHLTGETRDHAEHYIRQVPASMATVNRHAVEAALGWRPTQA